MPSTVLCLTLLAFAMLDPGAVSFVDRISPSGTGPDGPLLSETDRSTLAAMPSAEDKLVAIVVDEASTPDRRFVAARALIEGSWSGWRKIPEARQAAADVMVDALARDRSHNRWGLPGEFIGPFGKDLLTLEPEFERGLRRLLDDRSALHIDGSEAATLNQQARYRIADLAGWLLASGRGATWKNDIDPQARDAEIARLRNAPAPK